MRPPPAPLLLDAVLAALLTGLTLVTLIGQQAEPVGGGAAALAVLSVAPIALRQVAPVLTMLVIVAALTASALLQVDRFPSGGIGMLIAMFSVATLRPRAVAALMYPTTLVVILLAYVSREEMLWSQVAQAALICLGAWMLGESTRRWTERAERAAAEGARAVAAERTRIARDLHDVVVHHMSVVSLQAGVAEFVLDTDRVTARTAIVSAGAASRNALKEMRRMLGALRIADSEPALETPQPGLSQMNTIIDGLRAGGLAVELVRRGDVRDLPAGSDLCAFRIVQESLTNVLKHAGPAASARVSIDYGDRILTVRVTNTGAQPARHRPERGAADPMHGIRGMRERAELHGGVLEAGPTAEGEYTVLLRLPVPESAAHELPVEPAR